MPIWLRKFTFSKIKEWYDTSKDNNNEESWISGEAKNEASKNKKITPEINYHHNTTHQ